MSSEEYRFMLWVQNSDGTWVLWSRNRLRGPVEAEISAVPPNVRWRCVGMYDGILAESRTQPHHDLFE